jgi:hypothetical protein
MRQPRASVVRIVVAVAVISCGVSARADGPSVAALTPTCGVRVVEAPAGAGRAIEARLAALAACDARLDVWITDADAGGLAVIARDPGGRERTRVVPDAAVAAALLASWVEMDRASRTPAAAIASVAAPAGAPLADVGERVIPPDERRASPAAKTVALTAFAGGTTGGMISAGGALDLDLWRHHGLSLAALVVIGRESRTPPDLSEIAPGFFRETGRWTSAALVRLHRRFGTGRLRITPALAFGGGVTHHGLIAAQVDQGGTATPEHRTELTAGFRVATTLALGFRITPSTDLELFGGWMLASYQARNGVAPADHTLAAGIGVRYDR